MKKFREDAHSRLSKPSPGPNYIQDEYDFCHEDICSALIEGVPSQEEVDEATRDLQATFVQNEDSREFLDPKDREPKQESCDEVAIPDYDAECSSSKHFCHDDQVPLPPPTTSAETSSDFLKTPTSTQERMGIPGKELRPTTPPGSTTSTPATGAGSKKEWDNKNLISLAMLNILLTRYQPLIARYVTAAEAWAELNKVFEPHDIVHLRDALHTFKLKRGESMQKHISKFCLLLDQLASKGQTIPEAEAYTSLLRSLPIEYRYFFSPQESSYRV
ncbi:hypothetical protein AXG93_531s1280 [Marchantia polymorpha subsp. ruderalis]|uniref:Uncharacterized protein n=1 Tax=Marchantia polymorpha subsp. ruderalis TaxID=1480154 RepID=A0A176VP17_MARPO|nr:hypothetical protein AXG93_531s1280 [Marchantia polymorpha subsp. ruderalis]